ncbi:hypothetical protein ACVRZC_09900 [Streptococcus hyointestinalis]|nr:hypothetical protein [Streptococcus hyointestinalis]
MALPTTDIIEPVFVSHDYYFIEHVANRVLDIKTWQQENDT